MGNITQVHFKDGQESIYGITGLKQWNKGQKLEISGLHIDKDVEVHFSLSQYDGVAKRMLGKMVDGILHTYIPAFIMEGPEYICAGAGTYSAYAWVYVSDEESAETIRKMEFVIEARAKPDDYAAPEDKDVIQALKEDIESKVSKSGHDPDKVLATDADGNVITKDDIEVDSKLSATSKNPIQNKVATEELNKKVNKNHAVIMEKISMGRKTNTNSGYHSVTLGSMLEASNDNAYAEGYGTKATASPSHAEGMNTVASGRCSHAEGEETLATDDDAHAEGYKTTASADTAHAEGWGSISSNNAAHAEGYHSFASGDSSHSEGNDTWAQGDASHAEGKSNYAIGFASHVEGISNSAYSEASHVQGRYASYDTLEEYAHIIGNGTNNEHRSNIHTVDWNGNGWYKGRLSQDGIPTSEKDLTPKKYVDDKLSDALECIMQVNDRLYEGRDLTQVHAKEIADFTDEWNWIKERIQARNYTGIHVGDYIPMYADGNTYNMQIAGIDTYYNMVSTNIGHHIDFISKELYHKPIAWNTTANNNGSAGKNSPYLASYIYERLGQLANSSSFLPQAVRNVIVEKKTFIERRYSANGLLTESTTQSIQNIGKLWLPSEYEVFGSVVRGTPNWSQGLAVQYPLFANSGSNRNKKIVNTENIAPWWTNTVSGGDAENVCSVGRNASINSASNYTIYVPICFRIDNSN